MKTPTVARELLDRIDAYMDRFHLVMDTVDRVPAAGDRGAALKKQLQEKLLKHKQYNNRHGQDLPEIRNWEWSS